MGTGNGYYEPRSRNLKSPSERPPHYGVESCGGKSVFRTRIPDNPSHTGFGVAAENRRLVTKPAGNTGRCATVSRASLAFMVMSNLKLTDGIRQLKFARARCHRPVAISPI